MKDKIYLVKPATGAEQDVPFWSEEEWQGCINEEFIRKDALLEMLKGYSHPLTKIVMQELIDKINEL